MPREQELPYPALLVGKSCNQPSKYAHLWLQDGGFVFPLCGASRDDDLTLSDCDDKDSFTVKPKITCPECKNVLKRIGEIASTT